MAIASAGYASNETVGMLPMQYWGPLAYQGRAHAEAIARLYRLNPQQPPKPGPSWRSPESQSEAHMVEHDTGDPEGDPEQTAEWRNPSPSGRPPQPSAPPGLGVSPLSFFGASAPLRRPRWSNSHGDDAHFAFWEKHRRKQRTARWGEHRPTRRQALRITRHERL